MLFIETILIQHLYIYIDGINVFDTEIKMDENNCIENEIQISTNEAGILFIYIFIIVTILLLYCYYIGIIILPYCIYT